MMEAYFTAGAATELARIASGEGDPDAASRRQRANDMNLFNPGMEKFALLGPAAMRPLAEMQPRPGQPAPGGPAQPAPQQKQSYNGPGLNRFS